MGKLNWVVSEGHNTSVKLARLSRKYFLHIKIVKSFWHAFLFTIFHITIVWRWLTTDSLWEVQTRPAAYYIKIPWSCIEIRGDTGATQKSYSTL